MKGKIIGISITLVTLLLIGTSADARHAHRGGGYSFSFGYYSGPPVVRIYPSYRNNVWIVYRDYDRYYYDRDYYGKYRYYKKIPLLWNEETQVLRARLQIWTRALRQETFLRLSAASGLSVSIKHFPFQCHSSELL